MNVYKAFLAESGYQYFSADSESIERLLNRDYSCVKELKLKLNTTDRKILGDITVIESSLLILFSSAIVLNFDSAGSFIDLPKLDNFKLFVPEIIDALDWTKSEIDYFSDGKRLKRIRKYVFKSDMISEKEAFSLPIDNSPVFFTSIFFDKFKKLGLKGLDFTCVFEN